MLNYDLFLSLQNKSWFFRHKEFFRQRLMALEGDPQALSLILNEALELFPDLAMNLGSESLKSSVPETNVRYLIYGSEDYPGVFARMTDPPLILTVIGGSPWIQQSRLSVVGSRKATVDSLAWMEQELGLFCDLESPVLVSGGARGIDQATHALAIRKKLPTIVFLPSGVLNPYPQELKNWLNPILANGGCFISEYPVHEAIRREFFHHRNRLIAELGLVTLVIQASERSGTLMTGHLASAAGKPLWVVPGHPMHSSYKGNLKLLQEGATLVSSAEDLGLYFQAEKLSLNDKSIHLVKQLEFTNYS